MSLQESLKEKVLLMWGDGIFFALNVICRDIYAFNVDILEIHATRSTWYAQQICGLEQKMPWIKHFNLQV